MPRERRPPNRRELILDAALEAFAARGYEGTSYADLADVLEVTKAALYYHFPAKDDLLHALVGPLLDRLDAALEPYAIPPPWPDGTRALLGDYLDTLLVDPVVTAWVDGDTAVRNHPELGERLRANNRRMHAALLGPEVSDEQRVRAAAALGGLWRPVRNLGDRIDVSAHREALLDAAMAACLPLMGMHMRAGEGGADGAAARSTDGAATGHASDHAPSDGAATSPADRRVQPADRPLGNPRA